jgi:CheY-like chemotaxis protein
MTAMNESGSLLKILFIEDEQTALMVGKSLLEKARAEVIAVSTVAQAQGELKKQVFDLVITDIGLPDGRGVDIPVFMKTTQNRSTPIVALTAYEEKEKQEIIDSNYFLSVLKKPLDPKKAQSLIDMLAHYNQQTITAREDDNAVIDLALGTKKANQNLALAKELLATFMMTLHQEKPLLDNYYRHNKTDKALAVLHKLKGGVSHCGLPRLQKVLDDLYGKVDEHIKNKNPDTLQMKYDKEFEKLYVEIKKFIEQYHHLDQHPG